MNASVGAATMADITFHFPPELFNLLTDAIPALNKSKKDVVIFFRGAGVGEDFLSDLAQRVKADPQSIGKAEITRTVLERLNHRGEASLRERRDVLRRVVEFTNFDACWPGDQMKAKGLVASIRDTVNQKDAFTRMNQAREEERQARLAGVEHEKRAKQQRAESIEAAKQDLYALFGKGMAPAQRGRMLEASLNKLFAAFGCSMSEAFHLVGDAGEGIVEQVDGVIELKGAFYFVEIKWYRDPVGKAQISEHLVRLMSRDQARGLFISASEFTEPAVYTCREFLQHKLIVLCHLEEIVDVLEHQRDLCDLLNRKVQAAVVHKNPYFRPFDVGPGA